MGRIPTRINSMGHSRKKSSGPYFGLKFTAEQPESTVQMVKVGSPSDVFLSVSYDDGSTWSEYNIGDTITLSSIGDCVCFAASSGVTNEAFATSSVAYNNFVMTGKISASGDISSLRNNRVDAGENPLTEYCYYYLFKDCTSLTSAPMLPATELARLCYAYMFYRCTSLTSAPSLQATTLYTSCYKDMFYGCSSLTEAPELPALTLAASCYYGMFHGCSSLTEAPELPALTLATSCYSYMFMNCSSMTRGPMISASAVVTSCCNYMFNNCTKLSSVSVGFTSWGESGRLSSWMSRVSSSGTFTCPSALGTDATIRRGATNCPNGWTVINI